MNIPTPASLLLGLVLGFVVFRALEWRLPPERRLPLWREGLGTDLAYWFLTPFTAHYLVGWVVLLAVAGLAWLLYGRVEEAQILAGFGPLSRLPSWLQAGLMLLLADFIGYWVHRAFHGPRLWRFHAVHHSSRTLDWLSAVRMHPVNELASRLATTLPLLALGFAPATAAWVAPVLALHGVLLHAHLDWDFGPLRRVLASPRFHRWHHTTEAQARDKNFAGLFPVWDVLFGTCHLPDQGLPRHFGTDTPVPSGLLQQWAYPLRRVKHRQG